MVMILWCAPDHLPKRGGRFSRKTFKPSPFRYPLSGGRETQLRIRNCHRDGILDSTAGDGQSRRKTHSSSEKGEKGEEDLLAGIFFVIVRMDSVLRRGRKVGADIFHFLIFSPDDGFRGCFHLLRLGSAGRLFLFFLPFGDFFLPFLEGEFRSCHLKPSCLQAFQKIDREL
jgi:hypothetical protein